MRGDAGPEPGLKARYRNAVLRPLFDAWKRPLYPAFLEASLAHVVALLSAGVIAPEQGARLIRGLESLQALTPDDLTYDPDIEDVYFFIERALTQRLGAHDAGNLQLARSRNDLDMGGFRMVVRDKLLALAGATLEVGRAAIARARDGRELLILARTHGLPAQPTTLGHILGAYAETVRRNLDRYQLAYAHVNRSPLGACALAGTGFPLDRRDLASLLGFDGLVENTYDAVVAADYALDALAAAAVALSQDSRLLAMLQAWAAAPQPAIRLDPGFIQISSMMPQKRNIVFVEHLRARAARAAGAVAAAVAGAAATPFEDDDRATSELQDDLWRTLDDAAVVAEILHLALDTMAPAAGARPEAIVATGATATEVMDALVRGGGISQRQAHSIVSAMIEAAPDPQMWTEAVMAGAAEPHRDGRALLTTRDIQAALDPRRFIATRATVGGPAPRMLEEELDRLGHEMDDASRWLVSARERLRTAQRALRDRCARVAGG